MNASTGVLDNKLFRVGYRTDDTPQPMVLIHAKDEGDADRILTGHIEDGHIVRITVMQEIRGSDLERI